METNDYQIGGKHYVAEYQHWDWVNDLDLPYAVACATKYVCRWRKKNGLEDLRKAAHYVAKAIDQGRDINYIRNSFDLRSHDKFTDTLDPTDKFIITEIVSGRCELAQKAISDLIMRNV